MFLINSRLGLFTAALLGVNPKEHPFSRSYGVILPSSFDMVLSTRPSILYLFTCVGLGYGQFTGTLPIRSFFLEVSTVVDYDNSRDRASRAPLN